MIRDKLPDVLIPSLVLGYPLLNNPSAIIRGGPLFNALLNPLFNILHALIQGLLFSSFLALIPGNPLFNDLSAFTLGEPPFNSPFVLRDTLHFMSYPYGLADLVKNLEIPIYIQSWVQAVRSGMVLTGLVEDLRHERDGIRPPWTFTQSSARCSKDEWVSAWIGLQPLRRRSNLLIEPNSPEALMRPPDTSPSEWQPFWENTRQLVFYTLFGLHKCSFVRSAEASTTITMTQEDWTSWTDDVAWAFHQMIRLVGTGKDRVKVILDGVDASQGALQSDSPTEPAIVGRRPLDRPREPTPVPPLKRKLEMPGEFPQRKRMKQHSDAYSTGVFTLAMEEYHGEEGEGDATLGSDRESSDSPKSDL
ncbi:hypothetical protein C8Q79DRAFT_1014019 [Trametes meyenii]|nr:hypothetical protein C8Q79DRAFT_1014019 [Trametes meyenii]